LRDKWEKCVSCGALSVNRNGVLKGVVAVCVRNRAEQSRTELNRAEPREEQSRT